MVKCGQLELSEILTTWIRMVASRDLCSEPENNVVSNVSTLGRRSS
jgi:hypothetical protein